MRTIANKSVDPQLLSRLVIFSCSGVFYPLQSELGISCALPSANPVSLLAGAFYLFIPFIATGKANYATNKKGNLEIKAAMEHKSDMLDTNVHVFLLNQDDHKKRLQKASSAPGIVN